MKNKPWKPAGLQKFNEFCMAVNEDHKSPAGRSLRRNTNKRPSKLMQERNFARERLVLLPPLPCILMWRVSPPAVAWHLWRAVSM
jgi:hypothetical protein